MGFSKPSTPKVQAAPAPTVAATPPEPEQVAQAPEVSDSSQMKNTTNNKRKGTSALRIQLNVGGMGGGTSGLGSNKNGLSI